MKSKHAPTPAVPGRRLQRPALRFSPTAWAKLVYYRDRSDAEVAGFGIASDDDPLRVMDLEPVCERSSNMPVVFDERAVADFFAGQVHQIREGMPLVRLTRVWVHSRPGDSARAAEIPANLQRSLGGRDCRESDGGNPDDVKRAESRNAPGT